MVNSKHSVKLKSTPKKAKNTKNKFDIENESNTICR